MYTSRNLIFSRGGRRVWVGDGSGPTFWCVLLSLEKGDVFSDFECW